MTTLRQRFILDMELAGLAKSTQTTYLRTIVAFVRNCGNISPEKMTEQQVEDYFRKRLTQVARGTFQAEYGAIRFLFYNTLLVEWGIFTKKKFAVRDAFDCRLPSPTRIVNG